LEHACRGNAITFGSTLNRSTEINGCRANVCESGSSAPIVFFRIAKHRNQRWSRLGPAANHSFARIGPDFQIPIQKLDGQEFIRTDTFGTINDNRANGRTEKIELCGDQE
jgi:hypothetical protein